MQGRAAAVRCGVAANAKFYSANLAAEARKGLVQKAKAGGTPTRAPLGYLKRA